jgi:RNA recognition motif-containing protein
MNIFVGNLSDQTTESHLQGLFAEFGEVKSVKIIIDNYTNRSRGFGFVEMEKTPGETAIEKLNNTSLHSQTIVVNEARPKTNDRSSGGGGGGFNRRRF